MNEEIKVGHAAWTKLKEMAEQNGVPPYLRISVNSGGCSGFKYDFSMESAAENDDIIITNDDAKIFIDPDSLILLKDCIFDWQESLIGSHFAIKNPNAISGCGCGMSFSIT